MVSMVIENEMLANSGMGRLIFSHCNVINLAASLL